MDLFSFLFINNRFIFDIYVFAKLKFHAGTFPKNYLNNYEIVSANHLFNLFITMRQYLTIGKRVSHILNQSKFCGLIGMTFLM